MALFHSLLWLSSISLCMYYIFIFSTVDGQLGSFHVLAIVNSAATNTGEHVSFGIRVFSGYKPSSELLDYMTKEYIFKMKCRVPFDLFLESPSQSCHMLVFCTLFHPKVPMKQALPGKE